MRLVVRTLSQQLVEVVRERILSGEVAPEQSIRQDALAAELGVSKIPLREALGKLEQDGLLQSHPNRGFFVRPLSAEEAEEIYALRLRLEPEATGLAARRAAPDEQRVANDMLDALERTTHAHAPGVGAANRAFHLALLRPSQQEVTAGILERLHVLSERYVRKHLEPLGRDERANSEHRALLSAWLGRDEAAVERLTRSHIERTLEDLRAQLRDDKGESEPCAHDRFSAR
ncbi:MAG: GntR family transcriptional regulator [Pseudomonadota bacterium]|nr:GntR family transcriptional regulator [Pseudomonadota bacterium]